jgi:hypothetical protein
MSILRIVFYNCSLVTWTVVSLTTTKFRPLVFSMSCFALSYTTNMFIPMILYDFCLSPIPTSKTLGPKLRSSENLNWLIRRAFTLNQYEIVMQISTINST